MAPPAPATAIRARTAAICSVFFPGRLSRRGGFGFWVADIGIAAAEIEAFSERHESTARPAPPKSLRRRDRRAAVRAPHVATRVRWVNACCRPHQAACPEPDRPALGGHFGF